MNSLKNLIPSLIPVCIYFIADDFFGPLVGVICAIVLGSAEFLYTRIREKRNDKMILLTTLFFCIPGGIVIWSEGSSLEKLQPVFVEMVLCGLLGISAFSRTDMTATLPASYRKNLHITPEQQNMMKKMIRTLFFIICAHLLLSLIAIWGMNQKVATFICGPLLYILIGLFFTGLFIRSRLLLARMKKEEWLPVVNEKGEITGKALRSLCHSNARLLHPVVHLHITNTRKEWFLQKRSMKKKLLPGMWDTAVGGHVGWNETIENALKRETFEELGITDFDAHFIDSYVWECTREKELVFVFQCNHYNQISIENDEVDEGRFWTKEEIEEGIIQQTLTPNFIHEYLKFIK